MKTVSLLAALAAALITSGIGALALTDRTIPVAADSPARAYHVLGPVAVSADSRSIGSSWTELHAPRLAAAARARYGRIDAIADARHAPLPNGSGAVSTGLAVVWVR